MSEGKKKRKNCGGEDRESERPKRGKQKEKLREKGDSRNHKAEGREPRTLREQEDEDYTEGSNFYLPLFLLKETVAFVPHDREAQTREERPFSGFISQIRPQKRNHITEGLRENRENTKKSQGKETRQRKKKQVERE